jgi:hypothetical protein
MLTNSVLGIAQQLVIERIAPRGGPSSGVGAAITMTQRKKDDEPFSGPFGKGKARV